MVELDRASDSHLDPRVNVRQCPSQLILKYKLDVEARKRGWEEVKWDHLPLESGPGGGAASTILKIKNARPGWKSLLEGQLWNKYNANVHIHGVDGYVPCHHILFQNVSKMLEDIILDRVSSGSPPSSTKVLTIHLQDTKVCHIREVLKVLAKGSVVIDPLEEEGIFQVMKMLGIDKAVFEKLPVDGRTTLQVASRDVLVIADDGSEVDVEVVEEVKCGMCAFVFNSEIQLEVHLKEECVQNFMEFCQLQNRFCFGCAGRFPKYNAEQFIKHVDICVKTNCQRAQEYDEEEEEEVEKEQTDTESEFGSNSVKVCFLKECKVRCVKLTDTAINKIQNLIRCKKHVPLQRLQSYQYVFEVDDAVHAVMEARDESTATNLSKSVEVRRRKPCPLSKRKLQNKVSSHPGQDVLPPPLLIDVTTSETSPPEIPRSSHTDNTSLSTPSETAPTTAEVLPTPTEQSILTKSRKPQSKSITIPVVPSEPPPDFEEPPPPIIDVSINETVPSEIPISSFIDTTTLSTVIETPPAAAEVLPTPPEQSTLTTTKKRGPKSRTMPVVISEPPPDFEGHSPPPPLIDVPTTETPPSETPRSSPIDNATLSPPSETPPAATEVLITSAEQSTLRSSSTDNTTLYTVSETPPAVAEVIPTPPEQSTLTKTRKPGPRSRTMPVLTSEPPPDIEEQPPPLTDVPTTETPTSEIPRTSPTDSTTPTKTRKPGPKSRTMRVVTSELTLDMEEPSPPFSPIHSSRLSASQIPTQTPIPVPEQVTASLQTFQTAESTSIQTSRNVNEHDEAATEPEILIIVSEEAQTEVLFNENMAVNNVQLSENEVVGTFSTTQNSNSSCISASFCMAPTQVSPVPVAVSSIPSNTGCNDTELTIANPPAEVTQMVSSQCVDVRLSTPPHSIPSIPTLRSSVSVGPRSVTSVPFVSRTPIQSPRIPPPRLTPGPTAQQAASSMPQRSSSPFNGVRQHQFTSNNFRVLQTTVDPPPNSQSTQSPVFISNPTVRAPTRMQQQRVVSQATFPFGVTSSGSAPTQATLSQRQPTEYQSRVNPNQTRIQQLINSARGRMVAPTPPQPRLFNQQRPATPYPVARQVARVCRPPIQRPRQQRIATPAATIGAPTGNTQPPTENAWDYISTIPMRNFCNQVSTPTPPSHYPPASTSSSSSLNFDSFFDAPGATLVSPLNHTNFSLSCMSNEQRTSQPSERVHITCPQCKLSFGSYESLDDHYENGGCS